MRSKSVPRAARWEKQVRVEQHGCLRASAQPSRRMADGSVSSSCGSHTTAAGWWNAPTRFLPLRQVDGRLAADG